MSVGDNLFDVSGRFFFAAGAGGTLGSAIAHELGRRGAHVTITDVNGEKAVAAARRMPGPGSADSGVLDICDADALDRMLATEAKRYGRLDGVINAAGIFHIESLDSITAPAFRASIECNLTGPFLLTQAAARHLPRGGRILHLASVSSFVANPRYAAYASPKAGLSHMVRVAARELAPHGVTVNAIGPALTETPLTAERLSDPAFRAAAISQIPLGRLGEPKDILAVAVLLLAPGGRFITGQTIYADGGRTLV